jgi:prolyl 4-hydroxylase
MIKRKDNKQPSPLYGLFNRFLWAVVSVFALAALLVFFSVGREGYEAAPFPIDIELLSDPADFKVYEFDDFLTPTECQDLIRRASKRLEPSRVYNEDKDRSDDNYRISEQAWFKRGANPVVQKIEAAVAKATGMPLDNCEELQVVRYQPGGYFRPHYDACEGEKEFCQRMDKRGGPRLWTFMVYLTDDYEGGYTVFPYLDMKVQPKQGKLIVFQSTMKESEEIIKNSFHGGTQVISGEKWICNKWVRHRQYR